MDFRNRVESLLEKADIHVGGDRPWDIRVSDDRFYRRVITHGELGMGESYMDGWWDCDDLSGFIFRVLRTGLRDEVSTRAAALHSARARLFNLQSRSRAFIVGKRHYDIGNDLFQRMLDKRMIYSCGYWKHARDLDEAQEHKLSLTFRKLDLKADMHLLDVGCGWGGAARFASERYGSKVTGITISGEQAKMAEENCRDLPVDIRLNDYRELEGKFDRICSIGMFEHVGPKNHPAFMKAMRRLLKDDGLMVLHTIGSDHAVQSHSMWIDRYIFPNGHIPSISEISSSLQGNFVMEDWQNFGADYAKTLMCWYRRFEESWRELNGRYGDRFYRMWKYFLLSSAGSFRARNIQLWQIVLSPRGVEDGYHAPR